MPGHVLGVFTRDISDLNPVITVNMQKIMESVSIILYLIEVAEPHSTM